MQAKISRRAAVLLFCVGVWEAQGAPATLSVEQAWAPPTPPGAAVAAVYLRIVNSGGADDRLLSVDSPVARKVALHDSQIVDGMMQMRAVAWVACPAKSTVQVAPGGLHLMLMGLAKPLEPGAAFPLTLHFRDAGSVVVSVPIKARA